MSEGIFIKFYNLKRGRYGETAVFLLIILVILLISAVALVNIGRVGVHRLGTANAADSAALAGASAIAAVANNIASANHQLQLQFAALQAALLLINPVCNLPTCQGLCRVLGPTCSGPLQAFKVYMYFAGLLLTNYLFLMASSKEGFDMARAQAHRMAFANVGIEEAERRDSRTREILQPPLSKWLNDTDFSRRSSYTYSWHSYSIDTRTGEEAREPQPNEVTSQVNLTDCAFALDPVDALPVFKYFKFYVTGIHDQPVPLSGCIPCKCGKDMACFWKDAADFSVWLAQIAAQNAPATLVFLGIIVGYNFLIPALTGCPVQPSIRTLLTSTLIALLGLVIKPIVIVPPKKKCIDACPSCGVPTPSPMPAVVMVMYTVPVPWIREIDNDCDLRVGSTVTYREAGRSLGFWQRKATTVSSSAEARIIPPEDNCHEELKDGYDAEIIGTR